MSKENLFSLYDYVMHYNHYEEVYSAFRREDYSAYFNGTETTYPVLKANNIKHLIEYITKGYSKTSKDARKS